MADRAWRGGLRARSLTSLVALCALAGGALAQPARAPDARGLPALLKADEIIYDEELGIVTATGHVEVIQGERVLRGDSLSYNQRTNVVTASGQVSLLEPTGDVIFADYVELGEDLRAGTIQNFRMLLADQSRVAAVSARRAEGNFTSARRAVYSPCELCARDPTRAPLWQIKAERVTHDQAAKQITYNDAWVEFMGVPVAYTPYLSHPDGTQERASGFLAPELTSSRVMGQMVSVPYFLVLGKDKDLTIEPTWISKEAPLLAGEYRQRTRTGAFQFSASATNPDRRDNNNNRLRGDKDFRGHLRGEGRFDIDDEFRWGFDVARATDDNYLQRYRLQQRYRFLSSTTLTSNAYLEGFNGRNYAAANAYAFQGLRPGDDPGLTPLVLPMLEYTHAGEPGAAGGRFSLDANALSIHRSSGTRVRRGIVRGGWSLPYTAATGEIFTLSATLTSALYHIDQLDSARDRGQADNDGTFARAFPQLSLGWRYPWVRRDSDYRTTIEPMVMAIAASNLGSQARFANEDSLGVDFDETNLFRANRFTGYDRLESGQRLIAGFNADVLRLAGGRVGGFIGQSFRTKEESAFGIGSGLDQKTSNIVGRLNVTPHEWLSAVYRFQFDKENLTATRSVAGFSVGPAALRFSTSYVFIERSTQPTLGFDVEQLATQLVGQITPFWRVQTRTLHSLGEDSGTLLSGASLIYEDECFLFGLDLSRRNIGNRDNPPDTAFVMRLVLRNLGEIKSRLM